MKMAFKIFKQIKKVMGKERSIFYLKILFLFKKLLPVFIKNFRKILNGLFSRKIILERLNFITSQQIRIKKPPLHLAFLQGVY